MKMEKEFVEYLEDFIDSIMEGLRQAVALLIAIVTLPLWGYVFVFWYFFEYKPQKDKPKELSDTWKQQTMSRFERVE